MSSKRVTLCWFLVLFGIPGLTTASSDIQDKLVRELQPDIVGDVILPGTQQYDAKRQMRNYLYTSFPLAIVSVNTTADVQKSVLFSRRYQLRVSVFSSGHSYIGRSTGNGTLMLDMSRLQSIRVNVQDPESRTDASAEVQPGVNFGRLNAEADKHNLVAVGGISETVCIAGYSIGGGHSVLSPSLGLGADNLISIQLVTANGDVALATEDKTVITSVNGTSQMLHNGDLFWAMQGGGGAFGVITSLKIQLHQPPPSLVDLTITVPLQHPEMPDAARHFLSFYANLTVTSQVSRKWGGTVVVFYGPSNWGGRPTKGTMVLSLLHFGGWEEAIRTINPLLDWKPEWRHLVLKNYTTYQHFKNATAFVPGTYYQYHMNRLIHKEDLMDTAFTDLIADGHLDLTTNMIPSMCIVAILGGQVAEIPSNSSAVSDQLRRALWAVTCQVHWLHPSQENSVMAKAIMFREKFYKFGLGVYYNEPDPFLANWWTEFWGNKYHQLQKVKTLWDPEDFFSCHLCVKACENDEKCDGDKHTSSATEQAETGNISIFYLIMVLVNLLSTLACF